MKLTIDSIAIAPQAGQSLLELVRELGLDDPALSRRPLAAKIAGEVFTLNYVPMRPGREEEQGSAQRRAMAASGGVVQLLRYGDPVGREVYERTAQFVFFLALRQLYPGVTAKLDFSVGPGVYVRVDTPDFSMEGLREKLQEIIRQDIPLIRRRTTTREAIGHFQQDGQEDKAKLLSWRSVPWFDEYCFGDFADYFYGEMLPSTGYVTVWDIRPMEGGFLFVFPDSLQPDRVAEFQMLPNFFRAFSQAEQWSLLMRCETVADLNELTGDGRLRELVRINEALHEKSFSQVADEICQRGARAVLLAGPSSSGKTTSANRLAVQLRVHGMQPVLMSLDDYYIDRDKIAPGPDGKLDLEHINTIDTDLFARQLGQLLAGQEVELPTFNFKTGRREWHGQKLRLSGTDVVIVEGLHALNPVLLPDGLDRKLIYRMYVSPLIPLNLDNHNRIPTSYLRLLRRTVRDYETRGSSVEHTLSMWDSVRRGEQRWIFPYQENADVIFNSSTLYELAVLKKHIYPLLTAVQPESPYYDEVRSMVKILNYVQQADVDDEIPPTSIVREFIGGNSFYR